MTLAADAKRGQVKFSHTDHVTKNRSIEDPGDDFRQ